MTFQFSDGKIINADSCEDFVKKMRRGSFFPGENESSYMREVSERLSKFDLTISTQDATTFVTDLQRSGILSIVHVGATNN